jgi:hypothetical protein
MKTSMSKLALSLILLTVSTLSNCIPDEQVLVPATLTATVLSETQIQAETLHPKATSEPPVERFYRTVSNPDYLKNCKTQYPFVSNQQIGFRDIYPGKTTPDEVLENLGQPIVERSTVDGHNDWLYYDDNLTFSYHILIKENLVDSATVVTDKSLLLPAKDILLKYGCPDLIIATELDPAPFAETPNYNTTFFIYHTLGIQIRFEGYPILSSYSASTINYVKPLSLRDFLVNDYENGFLVDSFSVPVSLEEAIKEN